MDKEYEAPTGITHKRKSRELQDWDSDGVLWLLLFYFSFATRKCVIIKNEEGIVVFFWLYHRLPCFSVRRVVLVAELGNGFSVDHCFFDASSYVSVADICRYLWPFWCERVGNSLYFVSLWQRSLFFFIRHLRYESWVYILLNLAWCQSYCFHKKNDFLIQTNGKGDAVICHLPPCNCLTGKKKLNKNRFEMFLSHVNANLRDDWCWKQSRPYSFYLFI